MKKSSKPQKLPKNEAEKNEESVSYYLQHDLGFNQIMLTLISTKPMSVDEYVAALHAFLIDIENGELDLREYLGHNSEDVH